MDLSLDLSKHCIETELKTLYNRSVSSYFTSTADKNSLDAVIEMTANALNTLDFKRLRSRYPVLAGNTDDDIILSLSSSGDYLVTINGTRIHPDV